MKRIFCLLLAVLLLFSLAACKARVPEEKPEESKPLTAKELWEQAEVLQAAYTSTVYTMDATLGVTVDDIRYDTKVSIKAEEFDRQSDNPSYRVTQTMFGQKETYTYVGGTAYADTLLGTYKQSMTPEIFYGMAISDPEEADSEDFTPDQFGKVEIVKEDETGYTLTFSEPSKELITEMFDLTEEEENVEVQLTGEIQLDAEGHYKTLSVTASQTGTADGQEMKMAMEISLAVESFNQPVAIGTPAGASQFIEVESLKGLATVSKSLISQNGAPAGNLYKLNSIELAADGNTSLVQQQNVFGYLAADPLTMTLVQEYTENGEVYASIMESYIDGTYTFTVDGEAEELDVSEADVRSYIKNFPQDWLDAPFHATGHTVTEERGSYVFSITPDEEYSLFVVTSVAEELLNEDLYKALADADWAFTEQTMALTVAADQDGVAVAAKFAAKVTVEGEPVDITVQYALAPFKSNGSSAA